MAENSDAVMKGALTALGSSTFFYRRDGKMAENSDAVMKGALTALGSLGVVSDQHIRRAAATAVLLSALSDLGLRPVVDAWERVMGWDESAPAGAKFDRRAYMREYMRRRRAKVPA